MARQAKLDRNPRPSGSKKNPTPWKISELALRHQGQQQHRKRHPGGHGIRRESSQQRVECLASGLANLRVAVVEQRLEIQGHTFVTLGLQRLDGK